MLYLLRFSNLLFSGLLAGAVLVLWVGDNPGRMPANFYVQFQQLRIPALTLPMPLLGGLTTFTTLLLMMFTRGQHGAFMLAALALICCVAGMAITIEGNFPINAQVMHWSPEAPPENWTLLRDRWWAFHVARTVSAVAAFALLLGAALLPAPAAA